MGLLAGEHQWKLLLWQLLRGHPDTAVPQAPRSSDTFCEQTVPRLGRRPGCGIHKHPTAGSRPNGCLRASCGRGLSSLVFAPKLWCGEHGRCEVWLLRHTGAQLVLPQHWLGMVFLSEGKSVTKLNII